uniref:Uncharacterized protein n=1 Tax=Vitis vinifera TaxID=29760 RepID=F6HAT9_VITVI
MPVATIGKQDG